MPKGGYVGIDNIARKLKKGYVGIDEIARKLKKGYVGIGGVARPCFTTGLDYYGQITALSAAREDIAATTVGDYALFAGGYYFNSNANYGVYSIVDIYDTSLTKRNCLELSVAREDVAATTVGNYALFAGGYNPYDDYSYYDTVDAYDTSLVRTSHELYYQRGEMAATTVGNYALFGGGTSYDDDGDIVEAISATLTRHSCNSMETSRTHMAATTVGDYALFGGGMSSIDSTYYYCHPDVDAYNSSLTKIFEEDVEVWVEDEYDPSMGWWDYITIPESLSEGRFWLAATTVGDYALFAGGVRNQRADSGSATVDIFNSSLTRTKSQSLSKARCNLTATTLGKYALFAGGRGGNFNGHTAINVGDIERDGEATVDVVDESLTFTIGHDLAIGRYNLTSTTIGNYALFAGGYYNIHQQVSMNTWGHVESGYLDTVDVFTI